MLKANHYPERSNANAMLHLADETFSSNMQFEAMLQQKSISVLRLPLVSLLTLHFSWSCRLKLKHKVNYAALCDLGWGSIAAPSHGSPWVIAASYLIIIQIFLSSSSVFVEKRLQKQSIRAA
jgi:hypothetical protein